MPHKTSSTFWKYFNKLPEKIKKLSKSQFNLLKQNPSHPSLHLKKIKKFWSVRISIDYRALGYKDEEDYIWVWIGNHDDYEKLLKQL